MPDLQPLSTTTGPDNIGAPAADSKGTDALAHLAKMSGTGSTFGAADYVAINAASIAALIIGFAGALSLIVSLLVFLPIVGIGCGLLAIRQIRRSNGTQSGMGFAFAGIIVSLLIGGAVAAREVHAWMDSQAQTRAAADLVSQFGQDIKAGDYEGAYGLTNDEFHNRVDRATFRAKFEEPQNIPGFGPIQSIEWNHEGMLIENAADGEIRVICLALVKFRDLKDPTREYIRVSNRDGSLKIASIPHLFPEKKGRTGFPQ